MHFANQNGQLQACVSELASRQADERRAGVQSSETLREWLSWQKTATELRGIAAAKGGLGALTRATMCDVSASRRAEFTWGRVSYR